MLYNAGILTEFDKYGTFKPFSSISRAEVAAIISRMVNTSLRKQFTLADSPKIVYEYLCNYVKSWGYEFEGDMIYTLEFRNEDEIFLNTDLKYSNKNNSLSIVETCNDGIYDMTMELVIPNTLKSPYTGDYKFYVLYDEIAMGIADIKPSTLKLGDQISFSSYRSDKSYGMSKAENEEAASAFLQLMLVDVNEDLLKPQGYSIEDLGFTSFKY